MTPHEERGRSLAQAARKAGGLDETEPIKNMFEFVWEAASVDVLSIDASEDEHGLAMRDPTTGKIFIAVATTAHPMRQRSSIGHELGHVKSGDLERREPLATGERSPQEIRADAFARHLLLPVAAVHARRDKAAGTEEGLSQIVREYGVSPAIAAIQMRTAGLIDPDTCAGWASLSSTQLAARFGWLGQYRAQAAEAQVERAPANLMARALEGYRLGVLGLNEVALWYSQKPEDLHAQLGDPLVAPSPKLDDSWDNDEPLFDDEAGGGAS